MKFQHTFGIHNIKQDKSLTTWNCVSLEVLFWFQIFWGNRFMTRGISINSFQKKAVICEMSLVNTFTLIHCKTSFPTYCKTSNLWSWNMKISTTNFNMNAVCSVFDQKGLLHRSFLPPKSWLSWCTWQKNKFI